MSSVRIAAIVSLLAASASAASGQWKPAAGPLMTRWAKDVSPDRAHPEYPRPQMSRKEWQNLNGLWQYALAAEGDAPPVGKDLPDKILVPFPIESSLSGVGKRAERLWYRRTFSVPKAWEASGRHVLLHFQAVDWEATVYVNGKRLGMHRGGYDAFSFDITGALKPGEANELIVGVFDPTDAGAQPRGKQVSKPRGIWYTPTTGIWQTAWLEPVAAKSIETIRLVPDVDNKRLKLTVTGRGTDAESRVFASASDGGKEIATAKGSPGDEIMLKVPDPRLWSPDDPHLYGLKVFLSEGDAKEPCDTVESYFGMRKISLGKDSGGVTRIMLNGKFVFQIGPLDQGFWPDGLYAAPSDEALRYDIEVTRKLGFNMARKHVKIEPDRWYYWCDKLGLMVWQDMPSGNTVKDRDGFRQELTRLVEGMGNHPSIIMWVVFNEGWGQARNDPADTKRQVDLVRKLDRTRLISNASGWADHKVGDVLDIHSYPGPAAPPTEEKRAGVLGEFGGLGLPIKGHLWREKGSWGYRAMGDRDELTRRYVDLLRKVHGFKITKGLSAAVYTQTTDVEIEVNGLMTYDRAITKMDVEKVAAANRGDFPPPPIVKTIVPTSQKQAVEWRYTTEKPPKGWSDADFDDSAWKKGPAGFGEPTTPGAVVRTNWKTADIWIRREFELADTKFMDLNLCIHHDEDVEVYINGVRAAAARDYTAEYVELPVSKEARAALKKGGNVFAVHCKQTRGGQYIDVGLVDLVPRPKKKAD
ncbi:MAG: sugar-binding domain-containing protein [Phycisphaerae bacterium]